MRHRFFKIVTASTLLLVSCAPVSKLPDVDPVQHKLEELKQRQMAVEGKRDNVARLFRLSYPIVRANAELCGEKKAKALGVRFLALEAFGSEFHRAALGVGVNKRPTVIEVVANSTAASAGIQRDDILIGVGDTEIPESEFSEKLNNAFDKASKAGSSVRLRFDRAGKDYSVDLQFETVCDYPVVIIEDDSINASADGKRIRFHTGILRFASKDEELAIIIGHELAHNVMGHIDKGQGNAMIGLVFDILFAGVGVNTQGAFSNMAGQAYSQDFEAEADYVGLYFVKRAGMPIEIAPNFWRRMAVEHPGGIKDTLSSSHPATPKRFVALEQTIKEINAKIASGAPLKPEVGYSPAGEKLTDTPPKPQGGN